MIRLSIFLMVALAWGAASFGISLWIAFTWGHTAQLVFVPVALILGVVIGSVTFRALDD